MSNGRRTRRQIQPPAHPATAAAKSACPDCDSDVTITRRDGQWRANIAHDDNCPQLAWRTRHGATTSYALVAQPGRTIDADIVTFAETLAGQAGITGIRISNDVGTTWQERQIIDGVLGGVSGKPHR